MAEFTITEQCSVADIEIIESQPAGVFDDAAIEAIARFRFLPSVKDGTLVRSNNIRLTLPFEIDRSQPRARSR
jgi:protein TonB